jgi:transposase
VRRHGFSDQFAGRFRRGSAAPIVSDDEEREPGTASRLTDAQRQALVDIVERGPIPAIHGVVRWRLIDLAQWLHDEFGVALDETNISRELKKLGYVKLTARPRHHAQNEQAMEAFKKGASRPSWQRSGQASRRTRP